MKEDGRLERKDVSGLCGVMDAGLLTPTPTAVQEWKNVLDLCYTNCQYASDQKTSYSPWIGPQKTVQDLISKNSIDPQIVASNIVLS